MKNAMSTIVEIKGISGLTRFLAKNGETAEQKRARRFRSQRAAEAAAREHIARFAPCIQRMMAFEVISA